MSSRAKQHILLINEDVAGLNEIKYNIFHSVMVKLIFITKRTRPDIYNSVYFIFTQLSKSDEDDWKHFKQVLTFV